MGFCSRFMICTLAAATPLVLYAQGPSQPTPNTRPPGGVHYLEPGQRPVVIFPTVAAIQQWRAQMEASRQLTTASRLLYYHGGVGGVGVEKSPKVYLVRWGSQWTNNDPSGEAKILENFYRGAGGSSWLNSVTQYCEGIASGKYFCNGGTHAGNPPGIDAGIWVDTAGLAPAHPTQSQLAGEARRAAQHFGNTTATRNASAQYVIATAHKNNATGFGTKYCSWHSATSSAYGNVAYTNLPYITDAGATCGANFNGLGPKAGITLVSGHEMAESITDQFPDGGWLDANGSENGDKCAWIPSGRQGASKRVTFPNGSSFPVQSLWSNAFNKRSGGCVLSY
jgi:hypothetical protein